MICSQCKKDLPIECFPFRNKKKGILRKECKQCNHIWQQKIYQRNTQIIEQWKKDGCIKCGDNRPYVIDAHHLNPLVKEFGISRLRINSSVEKIITELQKCVPLCANCHREYHWLLSQQNISFEDFLKL